jgi:autotransporter adhesin
MNKSYVSVWNEALGSWVAASENTAARGKRSKAKVSAVVATALVAAASWAPVAHAQYNAGGGVAKGQTSIAIGPFASTDGPNVSSIAIGNTAQANSGTAANAYSATAIGTNAKATGDGAVALGDAAIAIADKATAIGRGATAGAVNSTAMGAGANATAANSVALGAGSTTTANLSSAGYNPGSTVLSGTASAANGEVSVGSAGKERRVTNVAAGSAAPDAVNVCQLKSEAAKSNAIGAATAAALGASSTYNSTTGAISAPSCSVGGTTVSNIGAAVSNIDGRVTTNTADIAQTAADISGLKDAVGLVQQDATTREITVGKDTNGTVVNMAGTAGNRTVTGVAAGAVNASSVDAINSSQLYANSASVAAGLGGGSTVNPDGTISAPSYSVGGTTVSNIGAAVSNIEGRTTQNTADIEQNTSNITNVQNQLADGSIGLVQQAPTSKAITVARGLDGTAVDFTGTDGVRTLTGVKAGALSETSTEAVNGSQLYATNQSVTTNTTNIAANTTNITSLDSRVTTVDNRVTSIDGRVTNVEGSVTNLTQQLDDGSVGLVQQDPTSKAITVARGLEGTAVNFTGTDGERKLIAVADGAVASGSKEAVNGGQLHGVSSSVADALGGGSTVNPDGTVSAPSYSVGGTTVHSVGDAVTNIDGRVTQNMTEITKLQDQMGDVGTELSGAVQYDRNADGSVNFNSVTLGRGQSAGPVVLTNVANGSNQYDAVNFGQLSALQDQVTDLNGQVLNLNTQMSNV